MSGRPPGESSASELFTGGGLIVAEVDLEELCATSVGSTSMLHRKVQYGEAISRTDQRKIKQAYLGSRSARSSGTRIVMLMALAVVGVMGISQALLAITGR